MLTLLLSGTIEARVRAEARKRGVDADQLAVLLVESSLPEWEPTFGPAVDPTVEYLLKRRRAEATTDPTELARRQQLTDDLLRGLDRHAGDGG